MLIIGLTEITQALLFFSLFLFLGENSETIEHEQAYMRITVLAFLTLSLPQTVSWLIMVINERQYFKLTKIYNVDNSISYGQQQNY